MIYKCCTLEKFDTTVTQWDERLWIRDLVIPTNKNMALYNQRDRFHYAFERHHDLEMLQCCNYYNDIVSLVIEILWNKKLL